ncbi:MAG: methyltransferase domain-containing protein [Thermodesulfobacteriota bacterium]
MESSERKKLIQTTFDTVADSYDNPFLCFFPNSAVYLTDLLELRGDELLLDIASGTGAVSLTAAARLPDGRVTGIDFSEGMLSRAREKAKAAGLDNAEFIWMDMDSLDLPAESFDAASCSFGLFFVEDMVEALKRIAGEVKPGGRIVVSSFSELSFSPLADLFLDRIRTYGVEVPASLSWKRLSSEESITRLFKDAGLKSIRVYEKDLGYYLKDPGEWWHLLRGAGFRGFIDKLTEKDLERFRLEHSEEILEHLTEDGIKVRVECLYGVGIK